MSLSDTAPRRAVVTGCTGSLGRRLVQRLLDDGWHVAGVARRVDEGVTNHENFKATDLDLAAPDAADRLFQLLKAEQPDLLVHAAVSYGDPRRPARDLAEVEAIFRVNAFAVFLAFDRYCRSEAMARFCTFIAINSDAMFHTSADNAVYAASKAALRVLAAGLAERCRTANGCVATLVLGPLADTAKIGQLRTLAETRGVEVSALTAQYLRRSNPFLVLTELIDLEACYRSVAHIAALGPTANGMVCRLDGGSAGSLI